MLSSPLQRALDTAAGTITTITYEQYYIESYIRQALVERQKSECGSWISSSSSLVRKAVHNVLCNVVLNSKQGLCLEICKYSHVWTTFKNPRRIASQSLPSCKCTQICSKLYPQICDAFLDMEVYGHSALLPGVWKFGPNFGRWCGSSSFSSHRTDLTNPTIPTPHFPRSKWLDQFVDWHTSIHFQHFSS